MGGETTTDQTRDDNVDERSFYKDTCQNTLAHASVCAQRMSAQMREKIRVHPVGYSGSQSIVNETNFNKKERFEQKIL